VEALEDYGSSFLIYVVQREQTQAGIQIGNAGERYIEMGIFGLDERPRISVLLFENIPI
jgi:hypothetical protein